MDRRTASPATATDPDVVDETMKFGATEEWQFVDLGYEPHPMPIRVGPIHVMSINGRPADDPHSRDSAPVPPFGYMVPKHQFLNSVGRFVMHCHIVLHQGEGLMQQLEVID
jgi:FtsP/CotA-like multicopper oxidase with cupredoxin domain